MLPLKPARASLITFSENISNRCGDKIQPCLTPFSTVNQSVSPWVVLSLKSPEPKSCLYVVSSGYYLKPAHLLSYAYTSLLWLFSHNRITHSSLGRHCTKDNSGSRNILPLYPDARDCSKTLANISFLPASCKRLIAYTLVGEERSYRSAS